MAKLIVTENIIRQLNALTKSADAVAKKTYEYFVAVTPKKTGNARNKTKLNKTTNSNTIQANYPYATELDDGRSQQAPKGMVAPTIKEMNKIFNKEFKNKG
jgi:hypothetical protein